MSRRVKAEVEEQVKKPKTRRAWRGKKIEPEINQSDIQRLKDLIDREEILERDLRHDMQELVRGRNKKLVNELKAIEDRNKQLIMWIGVTLLMLIIVIFWIMSLKAVTNDTVKEKVQLRNFDLTNTRDNLTKTMNQVVDDIDRIKAEAAKLNSDSSATGTATTSTQLPPVR